MPGDAEFSPEHPVARIRAKLEQRRVLEARFLLRQFSGEIDAGERQALEQEIRRRLDEMERLRHQARRAAAEGQREEAGKLYSDVERLVVDVPGLPEERASLAGAEAIFSRTAAQDTGERWPEPVDEPGLMPDREAAKRDPLAAAGEAGLKAEQQASGPAGQETANLHTGHRRRSAGLWIAVAACAGLAALLLLTLQARLHNKPSAMPPASAPLPAHTIVTGPADPGGTAASPKPPPETPGPTNAEQAQPQPQTPPAHQDPPASEKPPPPEEPAPVPPASPHTGPPADQTVDPSPALRLGTLQVKESIRQPNQPSHRE
jgi:hypothetical protein